MSKKSSLFLGLFFAMALIVTSFSDAEASRQRIGGMGMSGANAWMIQKDTAYIALNPAYVNEWTSLIAVQQANVGSASGVFLMAPTEASRFFFVTGGGSPLNVTYGQIMDTFKLGVNASYDIVDNGPHSSQTAGLNVGGIMNMGQNNIDFAVGYSKVIGYDKAFDAKQDNLGTVSAMVRYNMTLSQVHLLHIYAKGVYADNTVKDGVETSKITATLGLSDEMVLSKTARAYIGLANDYTQETESYKKIVSTLAFGVEGQLTENLRGRIGANRNIMNWLKAYEQPAIVNLAGVAGDAEITVPTSNGTIGMSYKIGNMLLEWNMNMALFVNGPTIIGTGAQMSSDFIAIYLFDTPVLSNPKTEE